MTKDAVLAELFVQRYPQKAAAVLTGLPAADAAAALEETPAESAAELTMLMPPATVVACLQALPVDRAAYHLGNLPARTAVALLRQAPKDVQANLVRRLPRATRIQVEIMLQRPSHRVGAWVESRIATVAEDATVEAARRAVATSGVSGGDLYLVDAAQQLKSAVALTDPAWELADVLPVVDQQKKLVGSVRHAVLRRAVAVDLQAATPAENDDYIRLADAVYVGMAEVLATSLLKPRSEPRGDRGAS